MRLPKFYKKFSDNVSFKNIKIGLDYVWDYLNDGETPGRTLNDKALNVYMQYLEGDGAIVELGGSGDYYKKFIRSGQKYLITNIEKPYDRKIDMTKMNFRDNSVDAFISMFALEHVYDYQSVINECYRCLKPGGRLILGVPFLYYYHGAPQDYFRFTHTAMGKLLSRFNILKSYSLGNRGLLVTQLYFEKKMLGSTSSKLKQVILRWLALPFLISGIFSNQHDPIYAITQFYFCEKPVK